MQKPCGCRENGTYQDLKEAQCCCAKGSRRDAVDEDGEVAWVRYQDRSYSCSCLGGSLLPPEKACICLCRNPGHYQSDSIKGMLCLPAWTQSLTHQNTTLCFKCSQESAFHSPPCARGEAGVLPQWPCCLAELFLFTLTQRMILVSQLSVGVSYYTLHLGHFLFLSDV